MSINYIRLFITSSSVFFTMLPILYLNNAYDQLTSLEKQNLRVSLTSLLIMVPLIYGITFASIYIFLKDKLPLSLHKYIFLIVGGLGGFMLSLIFTLLKIPEQWLSETSLFSFITLTTGFYALLFYISGHILFDDFKHGQPHSFVNKHKPVSNIPLDKPFTKPSNKPFTKPSTPTSPSKFPSSIQLFDKLKNQSK